MVEEFFFDFVLMEVFVVFIGKYHVLTKNTEFTIVSKMIFCMRNYFGQEIYIFIRHIFFFYFFFISFDSSKNDRNKESKQVISVFVIFVKNI